MNLKTKILLPAVILLVHFPGRALDWPQYGFDSRHVSSTQDSINPDRVVRLFGADLGARIIAGPIVKGDTVYVGTLGGRFYALDGRNGTVIWQAPPSGSLGRIRGTAVAVRDRIIVATEACTLYAFDQAGRVLWKYRTVGPVVSDLNYNPYMDAVYVTDRKGFVYSLSVSGELNWTFSDTSFVYNLDAAGMDFGVASESCFVAVPYGDMIVRYLKDEGRQYSLIWKQVLGSVQYRGIWATNFVLFQDTIFHGYCSPEGGQGIWGMLRSTGTLINKEYSNWVSLASPAVDITNGVYYAIMTHRGFKSGLFYKPGYVDRISLSGPVLSRDHIISYARNGYLDFRKKASNDLVRAIPVATDKRLKSGWSRPALSNGRIYFGTDHGCLYGYGDSSILTSGVKAGPQTGVLSILASPNPFNSGTRITVRLSSASSMRLEVFDASGRLIRTLAQGRYNVGAHEIPWDGRDETGGAVSAGCYFYAIKTMGKTLAWRAVLSR